MVPEGLRPQTLYGIADSPVALAAYFLDHDARSYELIACVFAGVCEGLTRDDILDNVTIAWLTNTFISGARLYWEHWEKGFLNAKGISIPVAESVFPDRGAGVSQTDPLQKLPKGGHFAAWEQPMLFSEEVRAGFRSLRWLEREAARTRCAPPQSSTRRNLSPIRFVAYNPCLVSLRGLTLESTSGGCPALMGRPDSPALVSSFR